MFHQHKEDILNYLKDLYAYQTKLNECLNITTPYQSKIIQEIENVNEQILISNNILDNYNNLIKGSNYVSSD